MPRMANQNCLTSVDLGLGGQRAFFEAIEEAFNEQGDFEAELVGWERIRLTTKKGVVLEAYVRSIFFTDDISMLERMRS